MRVMKYSFKNKMASQINVIAAPLFHWLLHRISVVLVLLGDSAKIASTYTAGAI
jgi:hypothetical protein